MLSRLQEGTMPYFTGFGFYEESQQCQNAVLEGNVLGISKLSHWKVDRLCMRSTCQLETFYRQICETRLSRSCDWTGMYQ